MKNVRTICIIAFIALAWVLLEEFNKLHGTLGVYIMLLSITAAGAFKSAYKPAFFGIVIGLLLFMAQA